MRLRSSQRFERLSSDAESAPKPTPHRNLHTTSTKPLNDKHKEKGERILRRANTEEEEPSTPPRRTTRRAARSTVAARRRVTRQPVEKEDVVTTPRTTRTTRRSVRLHSGRSAGEDGGDRGGSSALHPINIAELVSKDKVTIRDNSDDSSSLSSFQSPTEEYKLLGDVSSERAFLQSSPTPRQDMIMPSSLPFVSRIVKMTLDIAPEGETEETTERTKERQSNSLPATEEKHSQDTNDVEMERTMKEQLPTMGNRQSTVNELSSTANNNESTKWHSIGPTLTQEELTVLGEGTNMVDAPKGTGEVATERVTATQHVQPLRKEAEEYEVKNELLEKGDKEAVLLEENEISDISSIPSPPKIALSPKYPLIDAAKNTEAKAYTRTSVASYLSSSPVPSSPPREDMPQAEPSTANVEQYQPRNTTEEIATMVLEQHGKLPDNSQEPRDTEDETILRKGEKIDVDSLRFTEPSSSLGLSAGLFHTSHQLQHTFVHSSHSKQQVTAATSSQSPELMSEGAADVHKPQEVQRPSSPGSSAALFKFSYPVHPNHYATVPSSLLKQQTTAVTSSQPPQLFTFAQPAPALQKILTEAEAKAFKSKRADSFDSRTSDCAFTSSNPGLAELGAAEEAARLVARKQSHDDDESESEESNESMSDRNSDSEVEVLPEMRSEEGVREPSSSPSKRTASDAFSSELDTDIVMMWRARVSAEENSARLARRAVFGLVEDENEENSESDEDNELYKLSEIGEEGLLNDPVDVLPPTKSRPAENGVAREEEREIEPEAVLSKDDLDDFCRTSDIDPADNYEERGLAFRVVSSLDDSALDEEEDTDGGADVEMAETQGFVVPISSPTKGRRDMYDDISGANGSETDSESESEENGEDEEEEDDKKGSSREVTKEMQAPMQSIEVDESKDPIDISGETRGTLATELQTESIEIKKEPSLPRPISANPAPTQPPQQEGNSAAALIFQLRSLLSTIQGPDLTMSKPEVMDIERELNRIELIGNGKRLMVKTASDRRCRGDE